MEGVVWVRTDPAPGVPAAAHTVEQSDESEEVVVAVVEAADYCNHATGCLCGDCRLRPGQRGDSGRFVDSNGYHSLCLYSSKSFSELELACSPVITRIALSGSRPPFL